MSSTEGDDTKQADEDARADMNRALARGVLFLCANIASELARLPGQFRDREGYERILGDLASRCANGFFLEDEMVVCGGAPARLRPISEMDQEDVPIQLVMVTRAACKRYLEQSPSENAPHLLRAWFGADTRNAKRRRDEKRSQVKEAVEALAGSEAWKSSQDGQRCSMVEKHLGKPSEWCKPRTLQRAINDIGR